MRSGRLTASKGAVCHNCDAEFATSVEDAVGAYVWRPWRELDLQRTDLGDLVGPADLVRGCLANAKVLDFSFLLQFLQFSPRLLDGNGPIDLFVCEYPRYAQQRI